MPSCRDTRKCLTTTRITSCPGISNETSCIRSHLCEHASLKHTGWVGAMGLAKVDFEEHVLRLILPLMKHIEELKEDGAYRVSSEL